MKYIIFFCISFISLELYSQNKTIIIVSDRDNQALPFASVRNQTQESNFLATQEGLCNVFYSENDEIVISYVGYYSLAFKGKELLDTIRLKENPVELKEILVGTDNAYKIFQQSVANLYVKMLQSGNIHYQVKTEAVDGNKMLIRKTKTNYIAHFQKKKQKADISLYLKNYQQDIDTTFFLQNKNTEYLFDYSYYPHFNSIAEDVSFICKNASLYLEWESDSLLVIKFRPKEGNKKMLLSGRFYISVSDTTFTRVIAETKFSEKTKSGKLKKQKGYTFLITHHLIDYDFQKTIDGFYYPHKWNLALKLKNISDKGTWTEISSFSHLNSTEINVYNKEEIKPIKRLYFPYFWKVN